MKRKSLIWKRLKSMLSNIKIRFLELKKMPQKTSKIKAMRINNHDSFEDVKTTLFCYKKIKNL